MTAATAASSTFAVASSKVSLIKRTDSTMCLTPLGHSPYPRQPAQQAAVQKSSALNRAALVRLNGSQKDCAGLVSPKVVLVRGYITTETRLRSRSYVSIEVDLREDQCNCNWLRVWVTNGKGQNKSGIINMCETALHLSTISYMYGCILPGKLSKGSWL